MAVDNHTKNQRDSGIHAEAEGVETRRGGRPPAGTDPQKRRQILEGGDRVFSTVGFDAASMSDVAREAAVSKATLYVYFQDKEHLFTAVCAERRDRNIGELIELLDASGPLETTLNAFGAELLRRITQPHVIAAHRIIISVAERMPDIGTEFFAAGPMRLTQAVAALLDRHVEKGTLKIEDTFLAAAQLLELTQTTVFRPRLYAAISAPITDEEIKPVVASAVRLFLAGYGT
ncbi:MAG: TetR/AcrR family transcriptional regulator [Hyphomicrobium sp.]|jgi:AcrR family transcriptional regulator|uniref:TetR/AcrR family transcriptional regulator n=1 Tax=Hyphomicrobium sp. TaxID=82 RepID=UPI0025BE7E4C|nr:TetR/AcrR family transcriptional regulator [Hyphomicrobium sp.]MBX9864132.1 TetR/AcrR family transcriptional regulator [Hyphomicrobium sp.]